MRNGSRALSTRGTKLLFGFIALKREIIPKEETGLQIIVRKLTFFFLFLDENICCGQSNELSH